MTRSLSLCSLRCAYLSLVLAHPRERSISRSSSSRYLIYVILCAFIAWPSSSGAQRTVDVSIRRTDIDFERAEQCVSAVRTSAASVDSLLVQVVADTGRTLAPAPFPSLRILQTGDIDIVITGITNPVSMTFPARALTGRTLRIRRAGGERDLCVVAVPSPLFGASTARRKTDFFAEGAISNGLRTNDASGSATGSLGVSHIDFKDARERTVPILAFPVVRGRGVALHVVRLPLAGEQFRANITVANSVTEQVDSTQNVFRRMVLAPALASSGLLGSASVEYHPFFKLFDGTHGPRIAATVSRVGWRFVRRDTARTAKNVDSSVTDRSLASNVSMASFDARWRWSFIEQDRDPDDNNFGVSLELGYAMRWLGGDGGQDAKFTLATLGSSRTLYQGFAGALIIRLRQVTATAELPWLRAKDPLKGLTGLQPILTITAQAPLFTFAAKPRTAAAP